MSRYLGDEGEANTVCIAAPKPPSIVPSIQRNAGFLPPITASSSVACTNTSCTGYTKCVNKACTMPSKTCINNCNSKGTCSFASIDTGVRTSTCFADNPRCLAVCTCNTGWRGLSCDNTVAVNLANQKLRYQLISGLKNLTTSQDQSLATVTGWVSSVTSLTQNYAELSTPSIALVIKIVSSIMTAAAKLSLPYAQVRALNFVRYAGNAMTDCHCSQPTNAFLPVLCYSLSLFFLALTLLLLFISPDHPSANVS